MKKLNRTLLTMAVIGLMASCNNPKGETVDAKDAKEVAEVSNTAVTYNIQSDQSMVKWVGSKPTGQHTGNIPVSQGSLSVKGDKLEGGKFTIAVNDLTITDLKEESEEYGKLKGHLMSGEFFGAEEYPTAKFEITGVKPFSEGSVEETEEYETDYAPKTATENMVAGATHTISGNLTMKGMTKNISFPAKVDMSNGMIKANAKFNIDRTDWGVSYGDEAGAVDKAKDKFIYNTVNLDLSIAAQKTAS
ncbi:MAG: YceI family protein [Cyclobacteriaceae bacterium]